MLYGESQTNIGQVAYPTQLLQQPVVAAPSVASVGAIAATLTVASAASIGSNIVDVRNGSMSLPQAVINGVAKGAAASLILSRLPRTTTTQVLVASGVLAAAAYMIDTGMKKSKKELCEIGDQEG